MSVLSGQAIAHDAEMAVCRDNNICDGHNIKVYGIVVFVPGLFTMNEMPKLLGALDHVIAVCAANIPSRAISCDGFLRKVNASR